jgi:hypothetical protein
VTILKKEYEDYKLTDRTLIIKLASRRIHEIFSAGPKDDAVDKTYLLNIECVRTGERHATRITIKGVPIKSPHYSTCYKTTEQKY